MTPLPPGPGVGAPPPPPPPTPAVPGTSQYSPRIEPNWQPAEGRTETPRAETPRTAQSDPLLGAPPSQSQPLPSGPKLYPPEVTEKSTGEPPLLGERSQPGVPPSVNEKRQPGQPPSVNEKSQPGSPPLINEKSARFPAGIAQFSQPIPGVAGGLRPSIDDGLDWLAKQGYRTVLHVRGAGEADDTDRKQVEKLGMTYLSLEVSPSTLTRAKVEEFAKLVGDTARRPLFIYDQDGALAGPLWYLYFRKVNNDTDEVARIKADRLGLRTEREGPHRLMWLAVQNYLQENP
jgi:protein tyrosine phosphatase (PTP) superfamily phosphohydrolase (DUF442 family)